MYNSAARTLPQTDYIAQPITGQPWQETEYQELLN